MNEEFRKERQAMLKDLHMIKGRVVEMMKLASHDKHKDTYNALEDVSANIYHAMEMIREDLGTRNYN